MAVPLTLSSVPNINPYIQYVSANGQTVFPYPFPITLDSDLVAIVNGVTLATGNGYTLSGQGNPTGGNLTFTLGRTNGDIITIFRNVAIQRVTQISQNAGYSSTTFNAEYNQIYLIMQQLQEQIGFCLQIPQTNNPAGITSLTPAAYANKYLSFDANGNPVPAVLTSSGSVTSALIAGLLNVFTTTPITPDKVQSGPEIAAGVVPLNYAYPPGDLRRYATFISGGGDVTTALANACAQHVQTGGAPVYIPGAMGALTITAGVAAFNVPVTIYGDGYSKSQISTANDITVLTLNLGASGSILKDFQISGKGAGATLPGILFTNNNQSRMERVRVATFGVGVRFAQGANSCYLQCMIDCRIESNQTTNIDAQKATNQLRLYGVTCGGGPSITGLKLIDCTDCSAVGLNIENPSLVGIDIDSPSGGAYVGAGHTFIDPHFETATSAGDIRIGNTALVNGVTVIGGYTNPTGAADCGINIGAGGCNGLRVIGHNINAGYSGGVGYVRLTGALTNEMILLGGPFAGYYSQYLSQSGKVNYADRATLTLDAPSFLDAAIQDWTNYNYYKINSGSLAANKDYVAGFDGLRVESTGVIAGGARAYARIMYASNAQGGATKVGAGLAHGDFDIESGALSVGQTATSPDPGGGGVIGTVHVGLARVTPAAARATVILQAGITNGQQVIVVNEAAVGSGFSITFDAVGNSHVNNGASVVIAAGSKQVFVWNGTAWY